MESFLTIPELIDLQWHSWGDFVLTPEGDLADTTISAQQSHPHLSLRQEIASLAATSPGDWALHPDLGMGLQEFVGYPNDPDTALLLQGRIEESLVRHLSLHGIFHLEVIPVSSRRLGVLLFLKPEPLGLKEALPIDLLFSLNRGVMVL